MQQSYMTDEEFKYFMKTQVANQSLFSEIYNEKKIKRKKEHVKWCNDRKKTIPTVAVVEKCNETTTVVEV